MSAPRSRPGPCTSQVTWLPGSGSSQGWSGLAQGGGGSWYRAPPSTTQNPAPTERGAATPALAVLRSARWPSLVPAGGRKQARQRQPRLPAPVQPAGGASCPRAARRGRSWAWAWAAFISLLGGRQTQIPPQAPGRQDLLLTFLPVFLANLQRPSAPLTAPWLPDRTCHLSQWPAPLNSAWAPAAAVTAPQGPVRTPVLCAKSGCSLRVVGRGQGAAAPQDAKHGPSTCSTPVSAELGLRPPTGDPTTTTVGRRG